MTALIKPFKNTFSLDVIRKVLTLTGIVNTKKESLQKRTILINPNIIEN